MLAALLAANCSEPHSVIGTRLDTADQQAVLVEPPVGVTGDGETLSLEVVESFGVELITDHRGVVVYGNVEESPEALTCVSPDCLSSWIPLAPQGQVISARLDPSLFRVIARPDGSRQIVYNGVPLYLWAGDEQVGNPQHAGTAGTWFAYTSQGRAVRP